MGKRIMLVALVLGLAMSTVASAAEIIHIWTSGGSGVARMDVASGMFIDSDTVAGQIRGLTVDPSGRYIYGGSNTHTVEKFDGFDGSYDGVFSNAAQIGLSLPGMDFGTDGKLYLSDSTNQVVMRLNATSGAFEGELIGTRQSDIELGTDGKFYTTRNNPNVHRYNADGSLDANPLYSSALGTGGRGLAVDTSGNIYIAYEEGGASNRGRVEKISQLGVLLQSFTLGATSMGYVQDVAVAPNGDVFAISNNSTPGLMHWNAAGVHLGNNTNIPAEFRGSQLEVVVIPEPASLALLGLGGLMMLKRRRQA